MLGAYDGASRANGRLASGEYGFTATVGTGGETNTGNLVLTANAGKVIRVVPAIQQSDNGATLGFDNSLYVADPITPTLGGAPITGRVDWVNYLNSIGEAGTAEITAPAVDPMVGSNPAVKNVALPFTANTTGHNPGTKYKWDMGNGHVFEGTTSSYMDNNGTPTNTADDISVSGSAASITYAYPATGLFTARLYVTAPAGGDTTNDSVTVQVAATAPPTWTAAVTGVMPKTLELDGLPAEWTKIYVIWDDGTKQYHTTNPGTPEVDITHIYRKIASHYVSGHYVYNTTIRVYNGTTLMGTLVVPVTL